MEVHELLTKYGYSLPNESTPVYTMSSLREVLLLFLPHAMSSKYPWIIGGMFGDVPFDQRVADGVWRGHPGDSSGVAPNQAPA